MVMLDVLLHLHEPFFELLRAVFVFLGGTLH